MDFTIKNTRLFDLTVKDLQKFFKLTIVDGRMKKEVSECYFSGKNKNNLLLSYALYKRKKIGWIVACPSPSGIARHIQIFVHPDYRRYGVGTKLLKTIKKRSRSKKKLRCCPWDRRSRFFFRNFSKLKPAPGYYLGKGY